MGQVGKYDKLSIKLFGPGFLVKLEKKAFGWKTASDTYHEEGSYKYTYYNESSGKVEEGHGAQDYYFKANFIRPEIYEDYANGGLKVLESIQNIIQKIHHPCSLWLLLAIVFCFIFGFFVKPFYTFGRIFAGIEFAALFIRIGLMIAGFVIRKNTNVDRKIDDELYDYGYKTFYEK